MDRIKQKKEGDVESELCHFPNTNNSSIFSSGQEQEAVGSEDSYPLSHAQQALWYLHRLSPDSKAYNIPVCIRITIDLDRSALKRALHRLLSRHEALRTTFPSVEGGPHQRVGRKAEMDYEAHEVAELFSESFRERMIHEFGEPFDLEKGPLVRVRVYSKSATENVLLILLHHIIFDGHSYFVLVNDLVSLYMYEAGESGKLPPPPDLGMGDFVVRQGEYLNSPDGEEALSFWRSKLSGELPVLNLPLDYPRPAAQTFNGRTVSFRIGREQLSAMKKAATNEKVNLFTYLLCCYQVLLMKYTNQEDLIIGIPVSDRVDPAFENVVGYMVNMVAVRQDLSGNPSFRKLLKAVRKNVMHSLVYRSFPYPLLVEKLNTARDASRSPVFQTDFVFHDYVGRDVLNLYYEGDGREKTAFGEIDLGLDYHEGQFDLTFEAFEDGEELVCRFKYNTDLFAKNTVEGLGKKIQTLIKKLLTDPEQNLGELSLLDKQEKHQVLTKWNDTQTEPVESRGLHELFESMAAQYPHSIAVIYGKEDLTYCELNEWSNQLARHLQKVGVKPGDMVGLFMERSLEMLVGLLGVLKAGAAFIPMDPSFPRERLGFMVEESGLEVIVSQKSLQDQFPEIQGEIILLDRDNIVVSREKTENLNQKVEPSNLAYVIFTSGSTGRPKGVQVPHKAVVNFLGSMAKKPGMGERDVLLAVTTFSFDISILELFLPVTVGGTVVVAGKTDQIDGYRLAEIISKHSVTVMQATPSTWRLLFECSWSGKEDLKALCGGEALPPDLAERLAGCCGELWNMYGPTETTIWSTIGRIEKEEEIISIGRPIDNTEIYILDTHHQPVPVGVSGDLYIGGLGLSYGYLNRPDLTEKVFHPHPFIDQPGAQIYCTGDIARYLPDGRIICMGRKDHQVKLRGYRIELGEIEAALNRSTAVTSATVMIREDHGDDMQLVAYLVQSEDNETLDSGQLKSYLKRSLPDYMIPSMFVFLEKMPLTPNGKIDRKGLPAPHKNRTSEKPEHLEGEAEKIIAGIWKKVLNLNQVGIHDNFFDLGGHSMTMTRLHRNLKPLFKKELSIIDLLQYPTIHSLAVFLGEKKEAINSNHIQEFGGQTISQDIAIVGLAGRFPKAKNIDQFWNNLKNGKECVTFFTDEELEAEGIRPEEYNSPDYVRAKAYLENAEYFDAKFFGYSPMEAQITDPQQRIFLECSWEALEHAGYDAERYKGRIGVYAGSSMNTYLMDHILPDRRLRDKVGDYQIMIGNDKDYLCTRVSYKLNLNGPAVVVQSACSTSLLAVHKACRSLLDGECDMALAGGVSLHNYQKSGYQYREGMILSPDGHCRSFDEKAQGTYQGHGVGIVVLKRLEEALADGDSIHAIVKGTGANNDGSMKAGFTAPGIDGQSDVIISAQGIGGVASESISYVEAHGTATPLGDPVEIRALTQAFQRETQKKKFCAIGSVKSNFGHLDAAAGVTGLIKTVLSLKQKQIPPSLHYENPNPKIDFENSPFYVNTKLMDWPVNGFPRRAGVSSFGIGGTNVHAVLQEAPDLKGHESGRRVHLLPFSARTHSALNLTRQNFLDFISQNPEINLADGAFTLQQGRKEFEYRSFLVGSSVEGLISDSKSKRFGTEIAPVIARPEKVAFLFPGQGSQRVNMGRELYESQPEFQKQVDTCLELIENSFNLNFLPIIFPEPEQEEKAAMELHKTENAQLALFVIEFSLANLLVYYGIQPDILIGHSLGELVAATLSGVFSLPSAIKIIGERGRLMGEMAPGKMLSVRMGGEEVEQLLSHRFLESNLTIAGYNSSKQTVIAGDEKDIGQLSTLFTKNEVAFVELKTSHAFHSPMMEPVLGSFISIVRGHELKKPCIPFISNLTGKPITDAQAINPEYWGELIRKPVQFESGIQNLLAKGKTLLFDMGAGEALGKLVRQTRTSNKPIDIIPVLSGSEESTRFLQALGRGWTHGLDINWARLHGKEKRFRIPLPTYPFERKRFWIDRKLFLADEAQPKQLSSVTKNSKSEIGNWFYEQIWKEQEVSPLQSEKKLNWLIFSGPEGLEGRIRSILDEDFPNVIEVNSGDEFFIDAAKGKAMINATNSGHYKRLLSGLAFLPHKIVFCLNYKTKGLLSRFHDSNELISEYHCFIFLVQALCELTDKKIEIIILTNGTQKITGDEKGYFPVHSTLYGAVMSVQQECPNLYCRMVDLEQTESEDLIMKDLLSGNNEKLSAYREGVRLIPSYKKIPVQSSGSALTEDEGTYLITGGFGNVGMNIFEYLVHRVKNPTLILVQRTKYPNLEELEKICSHPANKGKLEELRQLRKFIDHLKAASETPLLNLNTLPSLDWDCFIIPDSFVLSRRFITVMNLIKRYELRVIIASVDIASGKDLLKLSSCLKREEGIRKLTGVFHTAGKVSLDAFFSVQQSTLEKSEAVFLPKVTGTVELGEKLRGFSPDFFILFSSISAVLGGNKYACYAAANLFQSGYAHFQNQKEPTTKWLALELDGWEVGNFGADSIPGRALSINKEEGLELLNIVLSGKLKLGSGTEKIVVSTTDLESKISRWVHPKSIENEADTPGLELHRIWKSFLEVEELSDEDNFFELGGDSLLAIQLVAHLRKSLNIDISTNSLLTYPTVQLFTAYLEGKKAGQGEERFESLVKLQKGDSNRMPLFLVHPVGGHVYFYRDLVMHLDTSQPVYAFQAKGIKEDNSLNNSFTTIEEIAEFYVSELLKQFPEGACIIGGASFGGVVALEMTHQLRKKGKPVDRIIVIDAPALDRMPDKLMRNNVSALYYMFDQYFPVDQDFLNTLSESGQIDYIIEQAAEKGKSNVLPPGFGTNYLQTFITHNRVMVEYADRMKPVGTEILFFGHTDPMPDFPIDLHLAWQKLALSGMDSFQIPGNHVSMNHGPNAQTMAEKINFYLK